MTPAPEAGRARVMPGGCSRPSIPTRLVRSRICLPFSKAIRRSGFPCRRVPPSGSGWRVRSSAIRLPLQEGRKARPIGIEQSCVLVGGPEGPTHVSSPRCTRSRLPPLLQHRVIARSRHPPLLHCSRAARALVHDSFAVVGGPAGPTHALRVRVMRDGVWHGRGFRRSYTITMHGNVAMIVAASAAPAPLIGDVCARPRFVCRCRRAGRPDPLQRMRPRMPSSSSRL